MEIITKKAPETLQKDVPVGTDLMIYSELNGVRVWMQWSTWLAYLNTLTAANAAVVLNTAKVGITAGQAAEIVANTAKLSGIEDNAKDDQTGADIKALLYALADTNNLSDALLTKLGFISATQAVDLDQMETDIAALANGMVYKDDWDASAGTFPGGGAAQIGWYYNVSVGGTVDGIVFAVGDSAIAKVNNASTSTYAANWVKKNQTDAVQSVAGLIGTITASALRAAVNVDDGATADQSDSEIEAAYNNQVDEMSQAEAEAGTSTTIRRVNALILKQAIEALAGGGGDVLKIGTPADDQIAVWAGSNTIEGLSWLKVDPSLQSVILESGTARSTLKRNELLIEELSTQGLISISEGQIQRFVKKGASFTFNEANEIPRAMDTGAVPLLTTTFALNLFGPDLPLRPVAVRPLWLVQNHTGDIFQINADKSIDFKGNAHTGLGSLSLVEKASANVRVAGSGQLWVKDGTPNTFWYTDAAGTDFELVFLQPKVQTITSAATITATSRNETVIVTALAVAAAITAPTGTFTNGQPLLFRFKDDATARALTWNAIFRAMGTTIPTTTVISKTLYVSCIYNSTDSKFDVIGVAQEA